MRLFISLGAAALVLLLGACSVSTSGYDPGIVEQPVVDSCDGESECAVMVADRPNEVLYFAPGATWSQGPLYTVGWEPGFMYPYGLRYYNGWRGQLVSQTVFVTQARTHGGWHSSAFGARSAARGATPFRSNTAVRTSNGTSVPFNQRHNVGSTSGPQRQASNTPQVHTPVPQRMPSAPPRSAPPSHATPQPTPLRAPAPPPPRVSAPAPRPSPPPPPPRRCGGRGEPRC